MAHQLRLFGPPQLIGDGALVPLDRRKGWALLAYLAVTRRAHSRDALAALLWPDHGQTDARANLRRELSRVREAIGRDVLDVERERIALPDGGLWVDVTEFRRLLAPAGGSAAPDAAALEAAVALYSDDLLSGFSLADCPEFDTWQLLEREDLRHSLAGALDTLADCYAADHAWEAALVHARRRLALDPLHEPAHRTLMRLYAWSDQHAAALRQYQECVRLLSAELGAPPAPETQELYAAIQARRLAAPAPTAAAPASPAGARLPAPPAPLVGRRAELAQLHDLLCDPAVRLVTILGPGGMGKTRLALAAAQQPPSRFDQGAVFVPLASLDSSEQLPAALAAALGLPLAAVRVPGSPPARQVLDHLHSRRLLLVLDSCEQLLHDLSLVAALLEEAPGVCLLATARERLDLPGEHTLALGGLAFPAAGTEPGVEYEAAQLFLQSARRAAPAFSPESGDLEALADICRLTEGMPLALELAAAWVAVLPLREIAESIRRGLDLLESDARYLPARQRSMRAVFASSWERLDEVDRDAFRRLSVFRGGFSRAAAQQVAGVDARRLAVLAAKSFIYYDRAGDRYQSHELLRQFAAEELAADANAEADAYGRHCAYYSALLYRFDGVLHGRGQLEAIAAITQELDNLLLVWHRAARNRDVALIDRMLDTLGIFFEWHDRSYEGLHLVQSALAALGAPSADGPDAGTETRVLARLHLWESVFHQIAGERPAAEAALQRSQDLLASPALAGADARREKMLILSVAGDLALSRDTRDARRLYNESLVLAEDLGERWYVARNLRQLGECEATLGNLVAAEASLHDAADYAEMAGDRRLLAAALESLTQLLVERGRMEEAEVAARRCYDNYVALGDPASRAAGLGKLGVALAWLGKFEEADPLMRDSLELYRDLGNRWALARAYLRLATNSGSLGRLDEAYALGHIGLELYRQTGYQDGMAWGSHTLAQICLSLERYDEAAPLIEEAEALYNAVHERGHVGWVQALRLCFALFQGELSQVPRLLREALQIALNMREFGTLSYLLPAAALWMVKQGRTARGLELKTLVWRFPFAANARDWHARAGEAVEAAAAALPPAEAAAAREEGLRAELWAEAEALLAELS